jgi:hypothetical protein
MFVSCELLFIIDLNLSKNEAIFYEMKNFRKNTKLKFVLYNKEIVD